MQFTTIVTNLFAIFAVAFISSAKPVRLAARDVFVPPITSPTSASVWPVGSVQTVTWDTSSAPVQITNPIGHISLGKGELITNITLASCFNILQGKIDITVPDVTPDTDYFIVLFGDSGNFSPDFKINN
ncbi:hypothetical protein BC834DRAFT_1040654 [Gloeopeniophorella convolvens]|nr:hypothetical protein BC834DRAFT_1040654 [Gloeopeniophorella convolvens]